MEKINDIEHNQYTLPQLIKRFERYFLKMAGNFTTNETIKQDLISEANIQLWLSNENYDPNMGTSFYTYVIQQTRFAMLNYLNQKSTTHQTIFVPNTQKENYNIKTISTDTPINENQTICDTIADEMDDYTEDERIKPLKAYMGLLKKEYRDIIEIKYQGYSDQDLAIMSGCSKQRIGQIVNKSIKRLQKAFQVEEVGNQLRKHTGLPKKEKKLRELHKIK